MDSTTEPKSRSPIADGGRRRPSPKRKPKHARATTMEMGTEMEIVKEHRPLAETKLHRFVPNKSSYGRKRNKQGGAPKPEHPALDSPLGRDRAPPRPSPQRRASFSTSDSFSIESSADYSKRGGGGTSSSESSVGMLWRKSVESSDLSAPFDRGDGKGCHSSISARRCVRTTIAMAVAVALVILVYLARNGSSKFASDGDPLERLFLKRGHQLLRREPSREDDSAASAGAPGAVPEGSPPQGDVFFHKDDGAAPVPPPAPKAPLVPPPETSRFPPREAKWAATPARPKDARREAYVAPAAREARGPDGLTLKERNRQEHLKKWKD